MQSPTALTETFRARGHRLTPQRQMLFRLLHGNDSHPTAEALFQQASALMPGISLRTVYQTLGELVEMGELRQVSLGAGPARFDPNLDDHHHAQCTACGQLYDVYVPRLDRLAVHGADGFVVDGARLVLTGRCSRCAEDLPQPSIHNKETP